MNRRALPRAVLLDTCAVIWLANGDPMMSSATAAIVYAGLADGVFVSPVSAWEVGLLSKPKAGRSAAIMFMPDPKTWFARVMAAPGIREAALTPEIAIDASFLPGELHGDPGDRLIVTTARHLGVPSPMGRTATRKSSPVDPLSRLGSSSRWRALMIWRCGAIACGRMAEKLGLDRVLPSYGGSARRSDCCTPPIRSYAAAPARRN